MNTITIEDLEKLATELEADTEAQRMRLARLCAAYHRILRQREPHLFRRGPCRHGDEAGHFDSSYPPKQEFSEHNGPRVIKLLNRTVEDVPTSGGYYYEWRRVTTDGGLRIGYDGRWYRSEETGTGQVGQFAAHPGDCHVDCAIEWTIVGTADLDLEELTIAEGKLRALAFPASARTAESA